MDESELLKKYNSIYLEIIMRYKEHIEENEGLNVSDLPKLVTPQDESVELLAKEIEGGLPAFSYEANFPDAAVLAYKYVKGKITDISIPIQFWLRPYQTIRYGAGDIFDKAVLLCSLLIAIGNPSSRILVVASGTSRSFVVYSEFKDKIIGMDLEGGINEYATLDGLLKVMNTGSDEDTTAYEFNDKMYRNIL